MIKKSQGVLLPYLSLLLKASMYVSINTFKKVISI